MSCQPLRERKCSTENERFAVRRREAAGTVGCRQATLAQVCVRRPVVILSCHGVFQQQAQNFRFPQDEFGLVVMGAAQL